MLLPLCWVRVLLQAPVPAPPRLSARGVGVGCWRWWFWVVFWGEELGGENEGAVWAAEGCQMRVGCGVRGGWERPRGVRLRDMMPSLEIAASAQRASDISDSASSGAGVRRVR